MPSLPPKFAPHVQTVPSDLRMTVPRAPPQMEMTSVPRANKAKEKTSNPTAICLRYFICAALAAYTLRRWLGKLTAYITLVREIVTIRNHGGAGLVPVM